MNTLFPALLVRTLHPASYILQHFVIFYNVYNFHFNTIHTHFNTRNNYEEPILYIS